MKSDETLCGERKHQVLPADWILNDCGKMVLFCCICGRFSRSL